VNNIIMATVLLLLTICIAHATAACVPLRDLCADPTEYDCTSIPRGTPSPCENGVTVPGSTLTAADYCCSVIGDIVITDLPCPRTQCDPNDGLCPCEAPDPNGYCETSLVGLTCNYGCGQGGLTGGTDYRYSTFATCESRGERDGVWMVAMESAPPRGGDDGDGPPPCPCSARHSLLFGAARFGAARSVDCC